MRRIFVCALACITLVGCGQDQFGSRPNADAEEPLLFLLMGGNASCVRSSRGPTPIGMGIERRFAELERRLVKSGKTVRSVLSCYENADPTVHYVTSDARDRLQSAGREEFQELIDNLAFASARSTFVAGHSYGGWLAFIATAETSITPAALLSLDPISRVHCTFTRPLGCTRNPEDLEDHYTDIAAKTDVWINYYQTRTWYLHSSPIDEATENVDLRVSHTAVDSHDTVWAKMEELVTKRYF